MFSERVEIKMKRIDYFDTSKAYLIFLVVLGHILIVMNPQYDKLYFSVIQSFIYSFHMSAFFIIHGVLMNNEKWKNASVKDFVIKRIYSLIVPYLFFEVIGIVCMAVFAKQDLMTGLYNMVTVRCNIGADWFLVAMFVGSLLYLIYIKHPNRVFGIISTVVCFIVPMFMSENQILIVLGRGMLAYGFIMIGNAGKRLFQSEKSKSILWIVVSLALTGAVAIFNLKFGGNDFYTCTVNNPITLIVGGISGTVLILGISRILHCKVITNIGNHTLTIMGTHQLVIYFMPLLIPALETDSIVYGIFVLVGIILFEIPIVYLMDKYLPFLVGRRIVK